MQWFLVWMLQEAGMVNADELVNAVAHSTNRCPELLQCFKRRRRTLTEKVSPHTQTANIPGQVLVENVSYELNNSKPQITDFLLSESEKDTQFQLKLDIHLAMLLKYFNTEIQLPAMPSLLHCVRKQSVESELSNVVYVEILSEIADSKATLLHIVGKLHKTFLTDLKQKWVLVIGDAKIFDVLQDLRVEYGDNLKWLIPIPGDWHVLYNYHKVLMKPYADAGLINLAKVSGYRAETLTAIRNASNFRRTHLFLLQSFEAVYQHYLDLFYGEDINEEVQTSVKSLLDEFNGICNEADLEAFRSTASSTMTKTKLAQIQSEFVEYLESLDHETYKFWHKFLFEDFLPYLSLYMSLRHRNWDMRMAGLKQMAALYTAFDHTTYQGLIPQHLLDVCKMPDCLKAHLKRGAFAIRLTSRDWCGVALDECHEMKINKDAKLAVIRPTREKMRHISNYLPFRSACINNLKSQLFPEQKKQRNCYTPTSRDKAVETNAKAMLSALKSHGMVSTSQDNNSGLCTILHHKEATPAQSHDLLRFRHIGQESFEQYVRHRMLNDPSTVAPVRQKRLVTFTVTEAQKRRVKVVEKETKMAQRVLKRQMAWMVKHEVDPQEINNFFGPTSSLPRALADRNGLPNKSAKSTTTKDIPVILTSLPWAPTAVILEGMFIIQTPPFPTMEHMKEYAQMLFIRYVTPHYNRNATEVHVVFDNPGGLAETPKEIEQKRRDAASAESMDHKCTTFHSGTEVPKNWRALLACRRCKSALTSYLAEQFLELAPSHMQDTGQEFFTNVKGVAYTSSNEEDMMERPSLSTNMDEADMRIWLHCVHSNCTRIVIFSPDTDIYDIGLAIAGNMHGKSIIIQLSKSLVSSPKLLDLNALLLAITRDPDLSGIPPSGRPQALQTLYVCTGCDYVSFFAGIGKCSFLSTFFQHASFIASNSPPGSIGMISLNKQDKSLF